MKKYLKTLVLLILLILHTFQNDLNYLQYLSLKINCQTKELSLKVHLPHTLAKSNKKNAKNKIFKHVIRRIKSLIKTS